MDENGEVRFLFLFWVWVVVSRRKDSSPTCHLLPLRFSTYSKAALTSFQFRVEVTNVMNWVNLAQPSSGNITSGSQATITSAAGTQRIIQLGGRLTF